MEDGHKISFLPIAPILDIERFSSHPDADFPLLLCMFRDWEHHEQPSILEWVHSPFKPSEVTLFFVGLLLGGFALAVMPVHVLKAKLRGALPVTLACTAVRPSHNDLRLRVALRPTQTVGSMTQGFWRMKKDGQCL